MRKVFMFFPWFLLLSGIIWLGLNLYKEIQNYDKELSLRAALFSEIK